MNDEEARFEQQLRGLFRNVDTRAGFEARVMERVSTLPAMTALDFRVRYEWRREQLRRRLRREAWANLATVVGIGAAAAALVLHHAGEIMQWAQTGGVADLYPWLLTGGVVFAIGAAAWPFLRRFAPAAL